MSVGSRHFLAGMKAAIPPCLGVAPVGISVGLLAVQAGLSEFQAALMSATVMAGASQLMAIAMITQGAAIVSIVVGVFFINLRHLVMSSSAMRRMKNTSLARRLLSAFALCDESFVIYSLSEDDSCSFLLGANTALYVTFVASTVVGSFMTGFLPQIVIDSFGIAFFATFLGLLIPRVKHNLRLIVLVLITGALNWLLQLFLAVSWSVILAMMLGALVGVFLIDDAPQTAEEAA